MNTAPGKNSAEEDGWPNTRRRLRSPLINQFLYTKDQPDCRLSVFNLHNIRKRLEQVKD